MRPNRSGAHDASNGNVHSFVTGPPVEPLPFTEPPLPPFPPPDPVPEPTPVRLNAGAVVSVGKYPARAWRTCARAAMKFWNACAMFWLLMFNCSSSAFSSGSLKISHQAPLRTESCGCAGRHVPGGNASYCAGAASLYPSGDGVLGTVYFGARLHAATISAANAIGATLTGPPHPPHPPRPHHAPGRRRPASPASGAAAGQTPDTRPASYTA